MSETTITESSLPRARILWGLYHPYQTIIAKAGQTLIPWNEVQCVLWFPSFDSYGDDLDGKKQLLQNFFEYLAIRILGDDLHEVQVIITMNNIIFSQLQVIAYYLIGYKISAIMLDTDTECYTRLLIYAELMMLPFNIIVVMVLSYWMQCCDFR